MATFLTAEWRRLIMAQYEVAPKTLAPWLPGGVELDLWQGRCYVSLVGFLFARVRLKGLPIPFHTRFEEINLRFYVRQPMPDGTHRRGVVFVREFVPRQAIAFVAKTLYEEPYLAMPTRHAIEETSDALAVSYGWRLGGRWHSLAVKAAPVAEEMPAGSEEEFLTEHYWGFTKRRDGSTSVYEVRHPRWQAYSVREAAVDADFSQLYGPAFAALNAQQPASVLLAEGSPVRVLSGASLNAVR